MDKYEDIIYQHNKQTGELEVDHYGYVWRVKTRQGTNGKTHTLKNIVPRRAEKQIRNGYLLVRICINGCEYATPAHRFIYRILKGSIPLKMDINHKNGIITDNRIQNLEVMTRSENQIHACQVLGTGIIGLKGQEHISSKLTNNQVLEIRKQAKLGRVYRLIAQDFNICIPNVSDIVNYKIWKHI